LRYNIHASCQGFLDRVGRIVRNLVSGCDCALLSGGVDTSYIVSLHPTPEKLRAFTFSLGEDTYYAKKVADKLRLKEHVLIQPTEEEFLEGVDWVLRELRTIDPVEVAADAVHFLTLRRARDAGCKCIASGDGGDELFLGYTFLLRLSDEELVNWLRRMIKDAWLPTVWVGRRLGIHVTTPLYNPGIKELIPEIPLNCLIDEEREIGKLMLRYYLDKIGLTDVAWRKKTPVTTGSGASDLLRRLAEKASMDGLSSVVEVLNFRPPTKLHAFLASRFVELGLEPPPICEDEERRCPICGRCINGNHCKFCGATLTSNGKVMLHG
jgi:asparagine synthase (glutamine-hydrolysing)